MYIVIVGGSVVGYFLCRALIGEGHEVLTIEKDAKKCERFLDELGSVCLRGDGCEVSTLSEAGTARADIFIATTNEDEDNLVACQVAKHKFNVPRTIAVINNPKNEEIFRKLGINCTVSITNLLLEHIEEEIPTHSLIHLLTLERENIEIVEVKITQNSKSVKKRVRDLTLPSGSMLFLVIRNGEKPRVPADDTVLEFGDRVIVLIPRDKENDLRQELSG